MNNKLLLGAHMSIEGGLYKAIERGAEIGCTAIQIFTASNRQWRTKIILPEEIQRFKAVQEKLGIEVISHCSYLINIGSPTSSIEEKSVNALRQELQRCNALGIQYAVLHPGSRLDSSEDDCIERIAKNVDIALDESNGSTMILLETMAGQGTTIGNTFEQLEKIRSLTKNKELIGICLDTCHIFASGYRFTTDAEYKETMKQIDSIIGIKTIKVIHINDSKKDCGEHVDRHEHIGEGKIGIEAFKNIMNDAEFTHVPKILETPKLTLHDDLENLNRLKKLISK